MYRYTNMLKTIRSIAPQAHIAGGAVRDTILQKTIHDIDVFIDDDIDSAAEEVAKMLRSNFSYIKTGEWKQYLGFSDPAMTRVAKFEKADEAIPLCIIGLKSRYTTPQANIARFDFGVCMAAFDGENTILAAEFDTDVENKTFTLCRADNLAQFTYSMSRHKKISAGRYKGWELSIPRAFEGYATEYAFRKQWYVDDFIKGLDGESVIKPKERVVA